METSKVSGVGCSYQRSETRGGTHFTVKTICRQLWGSSSAWVQTGKLCGGDHVGLEWMNEKGQRGAWDQAESVAERANITELKRKRCLWDLHGGGARC